MKSLTRIFVICLLALSATFSVAAQKLAPEEIIAKHLNSIATADVRASTKSLIAVGPGKQKFVSIADAPAEGRIVIASEATKMFLGMNMNSPQYPGQKFIFDGKKYDVAITTTGGRDFLGNFVQDNGPLLKAGIFGGTLSTNWLLANASTEKGKLTAEGTKKIDERETYVLQYAPKGGSDLTIFLYFDAVTFQHVRTEYKRMTSAPQGVMVKSAVGASGDNSGKQMETRISVTEHYTDYRAERGLMLPHGYRIVYSYSGNKGTVECEWNFILTEFGVNQKFYPATFLISDGSTGDE